MSQVSSAVLSLCWKNIPLEQVSPWPVLLLFLHLKMSLFCLYFCRICSSHRILGGQPFPSACSRCPCPPARWCLARVLGPVVVVLGPVVCSVWLAAFEMLLLCLQFSAIWLWSGQEFCEFILFEVCWASWVCKFTPFTRFGKWSAIISSKKCFQLHTFFFWDFSDMDVQLFYILPRSLSSVHFVFAPFFCCSVWVISTDLCSFYYSTSIFSHLHSDGEPIQWIFYLL